MDGLAQLCAWMAKGVNVPEDAFGDLEDEYVRFDFDGDGMLQERECYKLIKYHLRDHYKKMCPVVVAEASVPYKSLQSAGYALANRLGKGSQGAVRLAYDRSGGKRCMKVLRKHGMSNLAMHKLKEEFEVMHHLKNQHIARTFEIFQDNAFCYMVNEVYVGGDFTKLKDNASMRGVDLSSEWWRSIFKQCLEGLHYVHGKAVMHCDIKEPNLMLKTDNYHDPQVVIVDFGMAQEAVHGSSVKVCGTPGYIPPETWKTLKWYPKGDCFSMGVVMLQLLTDRVPIIEESAAGYQVCRREGVFTEGTSSMEEIAEITKVHRPQLFFVSGRDAQLAKLIGKLLEKLPASRPNAYQAIRHDWFSSTVSSEQMSEAPKKDQAEATEQSIAIRNGAGVFRAALATRTDDQQLYGSEVRPMEVVVTQPERRRSLPPHMLHRTGPLVFPAPRLHSSAQPFDGRNTLPRQQGHGVAWTRFPSQSLAPKALPHFLPLEPMSIEHNAFGTMLFQPPSVQIIRQ